MQRRRTATRCRMNAAQASSSGWQKVFGAGTGSDRPRPGRCLARHDPLRRRHHRELRRLPRAQQPHAVHRRRRAALHHRPERRRQDHDDGRDHRQDAPGRGSAWFGADHRPARRSPNPKSRRPASAANSRSRRCSSSTRVCENLELALRATRRSGTRCSRRLSGEQRDRIDEVLDTVGLERCSATCARASLSHGQKQWLEIGMLLMQDPQLLLVDEPVAGMTPQESSAPPSCCCRWPANIRWWWSSTTWSSCARSRARVTVLHEGRVLAEGSMDAVQNDPKVIEVYLGEAQSLPMRKC